MECDFETELNDLISELDEYRLSVHVESKKWREEGYEVEVGFYLIREHYNIDTWIDLRKVEQEFMEVFERISNEGVDIVSRIIENNFALEGATLDYVDRASDLEISENSSQVAVYTVDKNGKKKRLNTNLNKKSKLRKR